MLCVWLAAPNQFSTAAMVTSSNAMQFIPQQPVNYPTAAAAGLPQHFVPAGYGFYAPQPRMPPGAAPVPAGVSPLPAGFPVYASAQQKQFVNGAAAGSTGSGSSSAGTQQTGVAQSAAAGSWPSQTQQQVVNPFLVSRLFDLFVFIHIFVRDYIWRIAAIDSQNTVN